MAFLLTTIAGLSTILGSILIFFKFNNEHRIINRALSFAAGVMLTVSVFDLIPESYSLFNIAPVLHLLISVNIGIIISIIIDKMVPNTNELYRVGVVSMIAIILHNIPEGIATYLSTIQNPKLGIYITIAIALHNIPEGISISLPIYYATRNKKRAIFYTFISGMSELFGALFASIFLKQYVNNTIMGVLLGIIGGIMIHISTYELIPKSLKYKRTCDTVFFIIIGTLVMLISHLLIK